MSLLNDVLEAVCCGPMAVAELIVNEAFCAMANSTAKRIEKKAVKENKNKQKMELAIVEKKEENLNEENILNVHFSTVEEEQNSTEDEVINFIEDVSDKVIERSNLNLDESRNDIDIITVAVLLSTNKIKLTKLVFDHYLKSQDDNIKLNTIYKFFNGTKLFTKVSAIQLNEIITSQLLYETIIVISELDDTLTNNKIMTEIVVKTKRRLENEIITAGKMIDDTVDPVVPVHFNNGVLNLINNETRKISKTTAEYLINLLNEIIPEKWIKENDITFEVKKYNDPYDINKDTGMAILTVKCNGEIMHTFTVDLDSVVGNGYCIEIPSYFPDQLLCQSLFVSIEKFPEIVRNAIMRNYYTLNNPADPDSINEFYKVVNDVYGPGIYSFFDLSGMSKHFTFMTNEEKSTFGNNLTWISRANWSKLGLEPVINSPIPRMRIRKYTDPNKFTLVSDKNTRQQKPEFTKPLNGNYKTHMKISPEVNDSDILVVKFDNGKLDVSLNGTAINNIVLPDLEGNNQ